MIGVVRESQQRAFPSQEEWPTVAKDLMDVMQRAERLAGGPRTPAMNHNKALSECMHGLAWVTLDTSQPGAQLDGRGLEVPSTSLCPPCCTLKPPHSPIQNCAGRCSESKWVPSAPDVLADIAACSGHFFCC